MELERTGRECENIKEKIQREVDTQEEEGKARKRV